MSHQCLMEVIHHLALLQPQGLHHSQYPLRKAATRLTVIAKGVLPPQHTGTQQPLDVVVRRLDTLHCREQPQGGVQRQHVSAKRRHLRIGACATALQRLLEFLNHRFHTRLQCGTRPRTLAEVPPQPEYVLDRLQPRLTDCYRRATAIDTLLKITLQVRPAKLPQVQRHLVIHRPAVAADDALNRRSEQGLQPLPVPAGMDYEERHRGGGRPHNQRFWPACFQPVSSTFLAGASRIACPASVCAGASAALISCSKAATVPSATGT